jgi:acyl-coenzyme A thioesterase PaaI-like protein
VLNRDLLPDNRCFGCGHENHAGLRIEIVRDPERGDRLRGRLTPTADMEGFPGITHGGVIYTALDCLSTWVATLLGPNRSAGWLLRSASTVYHRPAAPGQPLTLHGWVGEQGGPNDPLIARTEARRGDGILCVEAEFKVVPLPPDKLARVAGLSAIPDNWKLFLSGDWPRSG